MKPLRFKPDAALRRKFMVPESFSHPAKLHAGLLLELVEKYSLPGQTILDPMAGSGTTLLAALSSRNVICLEMEEHFCRPMVACWAKMRQQVMLGCELGQVLILRGDARCLPLKSADVVDAIVTSPPWEDKTALQDSKWLHAHEVELAQRFRENHAGEKGLPGNKRPENRRTMEGYTRPAAGGLPLRSAEVECVITSPPWEDVQPGDHRSSPMLDDPSKMPPSRKGAGALYKTYTQPDIVVSSPPYEGTRCDGGSQLQGGFSPYTERGSPALWHTQRDQSNIGNLRGEKYWESMRQVYGECRRVLPEDGLMVLIVKGFTRDGVYQDLPAQTILCCEGVGFAFVERWERELWGLSFWRVLQGTEKQVRRMGLQMGLTEEDITEVMRVKRVDNGKLDDRLWFETVLVLRKACPVPVPGVPGTGA